MNKNQIIILANYSCSKQIKQFKIDHEGFMALPKAAK